MTSPASRVDGDGGIFSLAISRSIGVVPTGSTGCSTSRRGYQRSPGDATRMLRVSVPRVCILSLTSVASANPQGITFERRF